MEGTARFVRADGSGRDRKTLRRALALLGDAGWTLHDGVLRARRGGEPFAFEIMVTSRDQERLALALSRDLKRAGIKARIRSVDAAQYDRRRQTYDFDMIQNEWGASLSPGNEQLIYWGSASAEAFGSRNYMGVRSPAVDAMIDALLAARERSAFVAAVRALDRVLMSGFYVIPLFHTPKQWVGRWTSIARPAQASAQGFVIESWWRAQ